MLEEEEDDVDAHSEDPRLPNRMKCGAFSILSNFITCTVLVPGEASLVERLEKMQRRKDERNIIVIIMSMSY
jgi:hypothetical protein